MISNKQFYSVIFLCISTYLLGMFLIPLMDVDAAQYASISREMLVRNSFLQVFDLGKDYLDKPPMLFWLSALSMKILGVYDWSYRLPSILLMIIAIYATYQLAILYYEKTVAQLSAMVLASLQALFLMSHDVRTDTMLMSWVILSIWQLAKWYQLNRWTNFFLAFIFIGCGMMTKGPISLMVPGFAFLSHFLAQRNWKQLFRWEYLLGVIVIAIMLIPMSIGLYQQFDLHPGKLINNVPIKSGLRFYYWTQSFGRYTGENVYHEMSYFTFLLENMLWSFLPWIVFFLIGLIFSLRELIIQKFKISPNQEFITTGGFLLTYCILAKSQAQLPHYIFVVFPLAAITTARILHGIFFTDRLLAWRKPLQLFHMVIFALLWIALIGLMFIPFPEIPLFIKITSIIGLLVFIILIFAQVKNFPKIISLGLYTVIGVNVFLSTAFYPNLLKFQMGNDANAFINKNAIDKNSVYLFGINNSNALHFYGKHIFINLSSTKAFEANQIILTEKDSTHFFKTIFPSSKVIHEGNQYPVSVLTGSFLNPSTRMKEMPRYVMIDLDGKP